MKNLTYKCHTLTINELPNFKNPEDKLYRGTTIIDGKKWEKDSSAVYLIESWFQSKIDNLYRGRTYNDVYEEWNKTRVRRVTYKDKKLDITLMSHPKPKDNRAFYIGAYCLKDYLGKWHDSTIETIRYNKLISKFEKFVDEYCTDWRACTIWGSSFLTYKGYNLSFKKEYGRENYLGTSTIHKNSIFKCMSNSLKEIEEKFKARVDQILFHKQGEKIVDSKEERIKKLQQQIEKLQLEIEKVKDEKEIFIYKGVTLEYGNDKDTADNWLVGRIKDFPVETKEFYATTTDRMKDYFQAYIDELENSAKIYAQLMGLGYKEES